ncbi:MAG: PLP-dependent transferase, partial [Ignavibacteria bacterium]|nr:PLP-dependent transferase [Ignavibacteria bacterium]
MAQQYKSLSTKLIHSGEPHPKIHGAVSMPIFQSSTFEYAGEKTYDDVRYIRLNNTPNHLVLHKKLAALENAESALVTASGMAAISTALLSVLQCGDHLLVQNCLYGGTHTFITRDFSSYGISFDFINEGDGNEWKKKLRSNTKAI